MTVAPVAASLPREYETIYVLRPDVTRESSERVNTRVREVMERENAKLTLVETWGRRTLAYRIQKQRFGIYMYLRYVGLAGVVEELERNFRMLDDVMRYQTVLLKKDLQGEVEVNEDDVAFEDVEGHEEDAETEAQVYAKELGLLEPSAEERGGGGDDAAGGESAEGKAAEGKAAESKAAAEGAAAEGAAAEGAAADGAAAEAPKAEEATQAEAAPAAEKKETDQ